MRVLALSSSRSDGGGYLEQARGQIAELINAPASIAFIPFAATDRGYEAYFEKVQSALPGFSITLVREEGAASVIERADVIMVGGGNTFKLLHDIYSLEILDLIRQKVIKGVPYVGWSAGSNLAGLTIRTTNDMPVLQPQSFTSFGFFPFQVNPHYINQSTENFHGETRDQRLEEFTSLHPHIPVVGLPEGTALRLDGKKLWYMGEKNGVLFQRSPGGLSQKTPIQPGEDLSRLLLLSGSAASF